MTTFPEYKINNQTILQEQFDENYEPTQEEIREYAVHVGIDPDKESHLLWIAREGITKPLPPGWKPCQTEDGELYYFNFYSGKSSWDHPCDEIYKTRVIEERKNYRYQPTLLDENPRGSFNSKRDITSTKWRVQETTASTASSVNDIGDQFNSAHCVSDVRNPV